MASLQEQIDELRQQMANLQEDISDRAKKTDVATINLDLSDEQIQIESKLNDLEGCVRDLLSNIIDAREELRTHTH